MNLPALSALPLLHCNGSFHHGSLGPEMQHFPQRTASVLATVCAGCPRPRASPLPHSAAPHRPPLHRCPPQATSAPLPPTGHLCTAGPRLPGLWLLLDLATSQPWGIGGVERQRGARLSCLPPACSQGCSSSGPPCLPAAFPAPGTPAL